MGTAEPAPERVLLDTHAFLWLASEPERMPSAIREHLARTTVELRLSAASVWEMAIERSLAKLSTALPLAELIDSQCRAMSVALLDVTARHALAVEALPFHHRDPFDRLLVAQAMVEDLALASVDPALDAYPIRRIW